MISNILQILGLQPRISKVFSQSLEHFFLTVVQNNFGKKIPLFILQNRKSNKNITQLQDGPNCQCFVFLSDCKKNRQSLKMGNFFSSFSKTPNSSIVEQQPSSPFESLSDEKKRLYREICAKSSPDCKTIVLSGFSIDTTRLKIIHTITQNFIK